jgi:hypothetical protein
MAALRQVSWGLILIVLATFAGCSGSGTEESGPVTVTLSGRVVDSRGNLVSGATIIIDGQPVDVQTNVDGAFSMEIEAGDHELTITMGSDVIAVIPVSLSEGGSNDLGEIAPTASYYPWYEDSDEDGYGNSDVITNDENQPLGYVINRDDCDDTAAAIYPGAAEVCDGFDNNCNADIDEGVLLAFYQDADTDGYGNQSTELLSCSAPVGYVADSNDCDDSNAAVNPGATEICNSVDDNCDTAVDEGLLLSFYQDSDTDGFGNWLVQTQSCSAPGGYVSDDTDCDDSAASIYPGAPEICNDVDDNCNAQIDEGVTSTFYRDADEDNYGSAVNSIAACASPTGYLTDNTDCDDTEPGLNPETVWYPDRDRDNYPINSNSLMQCLSPVGSNVPNYLTTVFDCDDNDPLVNPGNLEILGNSIDDDCNSGTPDTAAVYNMSDLQGDWKLYGVNAGDYTNDEWNGWMQGSVSFDDKGQLIDYVLEYDDGFIETDPDISFIRIDSEGIVTLAGDPMFHGAISQDKDMIVATYTDIEGGYTMLILQKAVVAVTLADFKGLWNTNAIVAGDDPSWSGWFRGTVDVLDTGTVNFSLDRSDNDQDAGSVRHEINSDGDLENHWNLRSVSVDRQLAVGRADYEDGFGLEVLSKSGGAFAPGNLEGDWSFHVLSAGDEPEINGWAHGMMHFDNIGAGTINYQASSDPTSALSLGTLSVDSAGKILSSTIQTFAATLSNNKDTIVATFTNRSGGASMMIALRRDPAPLGITTEETISASAIISPAVGGALQVTASDGTRFDLTIPPDAIESDQDVLIKMTPISGLSDLPISGNFLGAVQLAPEGMQLSSAGSLTVNLPTSVPITDLLAYGFQGSGSQFHFVPLLPDAGTTSASSFNIPVWHFSVNGGGTGNSGDAGSIPSGPIRDGDYYESLLTSAVMEERDGDFGSILDDWYTLWVWGEHVSVAGTPSEVERALREYLRWSGKTQLLGVEDRFQPKNFSDVDSKFLSVIDDTLRNLDLACSIYEPGSRPQYNDPCVYGRRLLNEAILWINLSAKLADHEFSTVAYVDPGISGFCRGIATQLWYTAELMPRGMILPLAGTGSFQAELRDRGGNLLDEIWHSSDSTVAPVSNGGVSGESRGVATISVADPLECRAAGAFVKVDPSGPYIISVEGRANDNCHYNEPPDFVPIPDVLRPESATLTFNPLGNSEQIFTLDWSGLPNGMRMSGTSSSSTEVTISGDVDKTISAEHFLRFSQSCNLEFSRLGFDGSCEFGKLEFINVPTPIDQCKGKYWISGVRF